jgi:hypothetical protein
MRRRLESGQIVHAETYLSDFPALSSDPEAALDLIVSEFRFRRALGETPDPVEWYSRFPQWREQLERQLPALLDSQAPAEELTTAADMRQAGPVEEFAPGRHELYEEIGRGGMGVVHRARDLTLGRLVALKMIFAGAETGAELQRFQREAQAAARLRHPNIVPIYAVGLQHGRPCYTMPFIEGGTLAQHLQRFGKYCRTAAALMEKVARAVDAAHEAGVIHRDLKPSNILLDDDEPLVADFGLAKLVDADGETTCTAGRLMGTPAYMSPEQAAGRPATEASDVWSLGVVLYELLTGRRPFEGRGSDLALAVRNAEPPAPRQLRRDLPRDLETIILKCLEKDPAERYASAGALAEDLARWQRGDQPATRSLPIWLRRGFRSVRRAWRRPTALLALTPLVLLTLAAVWVTSPRALSAQEQENKRWENLVAETARELDAGVSATLIDRKGEVALGRWIADRDRAPIDRKPPLVDYQLVRSFDSKSLWEFLPDSRQTRYLYSADIRPTELGERGRAGLFFMADRSTRGSQGLHRFVALYVTQLESSKEPVLRLSAERYGEPDRVFGEPATRGYLFTYKPPIKSLAEWHTLAAVISPECVEVLWDGRPIKKASIKQIELTYAYQDRARKPAFPTAAAPLNVRGGLGLYIERGGPRYRNVVVKPQPSP